MDPGRGKGVMDRPDREERVVRILFLGDVVGKPGRQAVQNLLPRLRERFRPDFVLANGENAAGGKGITAKSYRALLDAGVDALTMGNHTFDNREIFKFIQDADRMVIPANWPEGVPGRRWMVLERGGVRLGVINLHGRLYTGAFLDCPFRTLERLLPEVRERASLVLVDFHAETTSEKLAFGYFAAQQGVSVVVGTHTHVQTADARILEGGTAYITDVGMCGGLDGVIGVRREVALQNFLYNLRGGMEVETRRRGVEGVVVDLHPDSGRALRIQAFREIEDHESHGTA